MESLRKFAKHCVVIVFALVFCLPALSEENVRYRVTVIKSYSDSSTPPLKINNKGQIIADCFLWSPDKGIQYSNDLYSGALPVSSTVLNEHGLTDNIYNWCPTAINDSGQIIGIFSQNSNYGQIVLSFLLDTSGNMQYLGNLKFRNFTYARDINNSGQVIGNSATSYPFASNYRAFLLNPGGNIQDLNPLLLLQHTGLQSWATAINNKGQIIGKLDNIHFLLDPISGVKLDFINRQYTILDINDVGQIIGISPFPNDPSGSGRAFIWRSLNASQHEFEYLSPENVKSVPYDINNLGHVVGLYVTGDERPRDMFGFIWDINNRLQILDNLIDPADPLKPYLFIRAASGINDEGQIIGWADIIDHPYTTSPCPTYQWNACTALVLLTPTTPSHSLTIDLLDPVPALLEGSAISTNPESLAKKGRLVEGVGADGVATLVLRIRASSVGESITLTLDGPSTDEAGALGVPGATPDALTTTVMAESTTEGPMAFALYRAPVDFAWNESHHSLQRRSVTLSASSSSGGSATKSIDVIRPPVVLVHGLWGSPGDWAEFDINKNPAFTRFTIDYENTNSEAFTLNARNLAIDISHSLEAFAKRKKIAIAQADFVAHSMGGDITRSMPSNINYSKRNFNKGYVHKLITIGTPHLGSPLARELIKPENSKIAIIFNKLDMAVKAEGAVGDLKGDGDGNGLSDALKKLQNVPMAMLAGRISPTQISEGKMFTFTSILGFAVTFDSPPPPLLSKFTPENYNSLMGGYHDGIVPLTSAINQKEGEAWGDGLKEEGGLHSSGTRYLGFSGPHLLQSDSVVSGKVIDLLNTPVTGTEFIKP